MVLYNRVVVPFLVPSSFQYVVGVGVGVPFGLYIFKLECVDMCKGYPVKQFRFGNRKELCVCVYYPQPPYISRFFSTHPVIAKYGCLIYRINVPGKNISFCIENLILINSILSPTPVHLTFFSYLPISQKGGTHNIYVCIYICMYSIRYLFIYSVCFCFYTSISHLRVSNNNIFYRYSSN